MSENETPDVLPAWANQTLILLWLLLFGGRWLLAPVLQLAGVLSAPQLAALDETVLLKLYLMLLAVTCIVVALRAVRTAQSGPQPAAADQGAPADIRDGISSTPEASVSASENTSQADERIDVAPAGGDETRD